MQRTAPRCPPTSRRCSGPRWSRSAACSVNATLVGPDPRLTVSIATPAPSSSNAPSTSGSGSLARSKVVLAGRDVEEFAMRRCIALHKQYPAGSLSMPKMRWSKDKLEEAYERCGLVTAEYAKTFYMGTQLMQPKQAKAIWAVYVWCRRTDELVDGPNASRITPSALDRWEERLEALFEGRPYDELDAALTDTLSEFPLDIQPFRDMVQGMRMDLVKTRYETYDELYEYCYRVAGTVGLMSMPVMGINPAYKGPMEKVYRAGLALGTANQLTNILRDVGEDIQQRNRIYVPLEELERFKLNEQDIINGKVDDRWREFMAFQIKRAREVFAEAEAGVDFLDQSARWPVWSALILYRQILDSIERNDYDNFSQRAYVPKWRKFASLPLALGRAMAPINLSGGASLPSLL